MGKECTGYRDQLELSFRSENEKVLRKAREPKNRALVQKASITRDPFPEELKRQRVECVLEVALLSFKEPMQLSTNDEGINFFFKHYVPAAKIGQHGSSLMPLLCESFYTMCLSGSDQHYMSHISPCEFCNDKHKVHLADSKLSASDKQKISQRRLFSRICGTFKCDQRSKAHAHCQTQTCTIARGAQSIA